MHGTDLDYVFVGICIALMYISLNYVTGFVDFGVIGFFSPFFFLSGDFMKLFMAHMD